MEEIKVNADEIRALLNGYAQRTDTDIVVYAGDIVRHEAIYLIEETKKRRLRKNVLLILETYGGDPNAAYRIARAFQNAYETVPAKALDPAQAIPARKRGEFIVFTDGVCKSAGTMICLGADRILMTDRAELGPIDTQLRKQDEVGERTSGLTPIQAVQFLETQSVMLFDRHFRALRDPNALGFSTKMAADLAARMAIGLLEPIYQQIDPIRLAEVDRSLKIAKEYGERLKHDGNLKPDAVDNLLARYPSHGFVIDRKEAEDLFAKVEYPSEELIALRAGFEHVVRSTLNQDEHTFVYYVSDEPEPKPNGPEQAKTEEDPGSTDG